VVELRMAREEVSTGFIRLLACEDDAFARNRDRSSFIEVRIVVRPIVDHERDPRIGAEVGELAGAASRREHKRREVFGGGERDQTAVGLSLVVRGEYADAAVFEKMAQRSLQLVRVHG